MRFQYYKRFICCLLVVILFGLGMCIELEDADSYLVCETHQQTETPAYTNEISAIYSDYCTTELLQRSNTHWMKNTNKGHSNRHFRNHLVISDSGNRRQHLKYYEEYFISDAVSQAVSRAVIVEYIHRQDGEK